MRNPKADIMKEFVPVEYYEVWAERYGISTVRYPYLVMDFDPSAGRQMPFAIYNFEMANADGWPCAAALLVYKAVHGKSTFRRIVYLTRAASRPPYPTRVFDPREGENDAI